MHGNMIGCDTEHMIIGGDRLADPPSSSSYPPRSTTAKKEPLRKLAEIDDLLTVGIGQLSISGADTGHEYNIMSIDEVNPSSLIAEELNKLSIHERDEVLHDLHGVADIVDERPSMLEDKLSLLEAELARVPAIKKEAYGQVLRLSPKFVQDRHFRLMFLRATRFEAKDAAMRLVNFFEQKQRIFGRDKLAKKITLDDLDVDTLACLNTGYLQLLPGRDRSGRAVLMGFSRFRRFHAKINLLRAFWYMTMTALEDEDTQKRGVVLISYSIGGSVIGQSGAFAVACLLHALPMRAAGAHACVDDPKLQGLVAFVSLFAGSHNRRRLRIHIGSYLECQYSLMTFGIPTQIQPISSEGVLDKTTFLKWMDMRRKLEEQRQLLVVAEQQQGKPSTVATTRPTHIINSTNGNSIAIIMVPGPKDILLGRGKMIQENPGNLRYRKIIEKHLTHYETALKSNKTNIALDLVKMLNDEGWKFLKQSDGVDGWLEVPAEVAREKVSHWFRNRRSLLNGTKKKKGSFKRDAKEKQLSKSSNHSEASG